MAQALRVASVIQGSSRGIGLALTKRLLTIRDPKTKNPNTAVNLKSLAGEFPHLITLPLDVTEEYTIQKAAEELTAHASSVDVLINSAGILRPENSLSKVSLENLTETFRVNAWGPLLVAKHFSRLLGKGSKFASISARAGSISENKIGGWYSHRGSKAALNMFTRSLAAELSRNKAIAVAVDPGLVDTDMTRAHMKGANPALVQSPDAVAKQIVALVDALQDKDNGKFFQFDGVEIAW